MAFTIHAIFWYASLFVLTLYNSSVTFHAESQQFPTLAEKNQQSALKWRSLTDEERECYCRDASAHNSGDTVVNQNKEANKIIKHLVDMVNKCIDFFHVA